MRLPRGVQDFLKLAAELLVMKIEGRVLMSRWDRLLDPLADRLLVEETGKVPIHQLS
jgi:hypothetical protein